MVDDVPFFQLFFLSPGVHPSVRSSVCMSVCNLPNKGFRSKIYDFILKILWYKNCSFNNWSFSPFGTKGKLFKTLRILYNVFIKLKSSFKSFSKPPKNFVHDLKYLTIAYPKADEKLDSCLPLWWRSLQNKVLWLRKEKNWKK